MNSITMRNRSNRNILKVAFTDKHISYLIFAGKKITDACLIIYFIIRYQCYSLYELNNFNLKSRAQASRTPTAAAAVQLAPAQQ